MRNTEGQIGAGRNLYSLIQPYDYHILDVGDGHNLYVEECGNPNGVPVVCLLYTSPSPRDRTRSRMPSSA